VRIEACNNIEEAKVEVVIFIILLLGALMVIGFLSSLVGLVLPILVWMLAGMFAGRIIRGRGYGPLGDILLGLAGGLVGSALLRLLGLGVAGGLIGHLIVGVLGAVVLVYVVRFIGSSRFAS
jgi:uncharacterized membrane protein YeaQ/YmgE (transglycosylase-associated protein family)